LTAVFESEQASFVVCNTNCTFTISSAYTGITAAFIDHDFLVLFSRILLIHDYLEFSTMAQAFLERAFGIAPFRPPLTRSGSSDSVASAVTAGSSSHAQLSDSSTPPTSAADSDSVSFAATKLTNGIDGNADAEPESDTEADPRAQRKIVTTSRTRRTRTSLVGTYNIKVLAGTDIHAPRKFRSMHSIETPKETRRRTISGDTRPSTIASIEELNVTKKKDVNMLLRGGPKVVDVHLLGKKLLKSRSVMGLKVGENPRKMNATNKHGETITRRLTRSTGEPVDSLAKKLSVLGKRGRDKFEAGLVKAKRELKRLADTNEFAKIDTKPVLAEVWSNGKLVTGEEPPRKKVKAEVTTIVKAKEETNLVEKSKPKKKGPKVWLNKGLYAGQDGRNLDWFSGLSKDERKKMANVPLPPEPNSILPLPMWHGQRLLHIGRNFKLPFDVCSPLPPGQPKPDEWRKVPKSEDLNQLYGYTFNANWFNSRPIRR
jgi:[histone H3]-lysine4 N-trimethyltransferase ASH1L